MIDLIPNLLISRKDLKNFAIYLKNLVKFSFVKKYFCDICKNWIEKLPNPLEIDIMRLILYSDLNYFDENLKKYENELGKENLKNTFQELLNEGCKSEHILRKFHSLVSEIYAGNELQKEGFKDLKKIKSYGDWESKGKIISVKTIFDLSFNFEIIENVLKGLIFIKENIILRKYNNVYIGEYKNLNYLFLEKILKFIRDDLIKYFTDIEKNIQSNIFYKIEKDNVSIFASYGYVLIEIHDENSFIKINFEENCESNLYNFRTSENSFAINEKFDLIKIKKKIDEKINDFNKNICKDNFIGWINICIHPKHESYIKNNFKILKEELKDYLKLKEYPIYFCFLPKIGFDFKDPIIFEIN